MLTTQTKYCIRMFARFRAQQIWESTPEVKKEELNEIIRLSKMDSEDFRYYAEEVGKRLYELGRNS